MTLSCHTVGEIWNNSWTVQLRDEDPVEKKNKNPLNEIKFIFFGNRFKTSSSKLVTENIESKKVTEITFLGELIDSKFSWKLHLNYIDANAQSNKSPEDKR